MPYKVCHVVFSTNRINYLSRTLESTRKINYRHCEVTRVLFDDYPTGRNNKLVSVLAHAHDFKTQFLHQENQGITKTWQEMFEFVRAGDFDYIWSQEDDAVIMYPFKMLDLIEMLQEDKTLSQIQLKRDNWYPFETEKIGPKDTDTIWGNYRIERGNPYFWMMSTLYPAWIAKEPILETTGHNPSECVVANYVSQNFGSSTGLLKTAEGGIMVDHIGEYTKGKKVAEGEPGWEGFKSFDPNLIYDSRTGHLASL